MLKTKKQDNDGFTLVELLVSIALFTIVMTIAIGSIVTIVDTNRKSRALTLVMNNLGFSLESITRTIKTTKDINPGSPIEFTNQDDEVVSYEKTGDTITKCVDGSCSPIVSEEVIIETFSLTELGGGADDQPRYLMNVQGYAEISIKTRTEFNIQTTVSPRNLQI
jgi:prepilin-type N-terminal cleavage/methylation domain-containing protein